MFALLHALGRTRRRRVLMALFAAFIGVPLTGQAAMAASNAVLGTAPATLFWIHIEDTHHVNVWNYQLAINRDGMIPNPWAYFTDWLFGCYLSWVVLALWFVDWVLSMQWLPTLAGPMIQIGDALHQAVTHTGIAQAFLTFAAFVAGMWALRGRVTTAIWEVMMACIIAGIAMGALANPIHQIAGPDGWIVKAGQSGAEVAAGLAGQDTRGLTGDQIRTKQTEQLATTFVRQPTQLISFGHVLTGACDQAYTDAIKDGPSDDSSKVLDKIKGCDKAGADYADNPSVSMAMGAFTLLPAAFLIFGYFAYQAGSLLLDAVRTMVEAIKANVTFLLGILPGGPRGSMALTIAGIGVKLFTIGYSTVFLALLLIVINAIFAGADGQALGKTFIIVDALIIIGIITWYKERKRLAHTRERLAQWMAQRPGGPPARLPQQVGGPNIARSLGMVKDAVTIAMLVKQNRGHRSGYPTPEVASSSTVQAEFQPDPRPGAGAAAAAALPGRGPQLALPAGPGGDAPSGSGPSGSGPWGPGPTPGPGGSMGPAGGPVGPEPGLPGGSGSGGAVMPTPAQRGESIRVRARKTGGALVRAGTDVALAAATGGTSTAATAARAGQAAQKTALLTKLATARTNGPAASSAPAPTAGAGSAGAQGAAGRPVPPATGEVIQGIVLDARPPQPGSGPTGAGASPVPAATRHRATSGRPATPPVTRTPGPTPTSPPAATSGIGGGAHRPSAATPGTAGAAKATARATPPPPVTPTSAPASSPASRTTPAPAAAAAAQRPTPAPPQPAAPTPRPHPAAPAPAHTSQATAEADRRAKAEQLHATLAARRARSAGRIPGKGA